MIDMTMFDVIVLLYKTIALSLFALGFVVMNILLVVLIVYCGASVYRKVFSNDRANVSQNYPRNMATRNR